MHYILPSDYIPRPLEALEEISSKANFDLSEVEAEKQLKKLRRKLAKLQDKMYAHGKYGVLVCLQGMDTAGKDSLIREVFKDLNARGVVVHSFKTPTALEKRHDYLWRHYVALPERGKFSVFNRTHYENVLVTRVHPNYILGENIPKVESTDDITPGFWDNRFRQINDFERHISENGTVIFKFFLHISKEEQRQRLLRRLENKSHQWKFSPADLKERELWNLYQDCYKDILNQTSKPHAPWYVIPSDDKVLSRLIVASIIYEVLSNYHDIQEPQLDAETEANIQFYKTKLSNEN
ncbi:MAG: polyphosphate kinase 2 family protein [Flavobacteriaceae bacterium]|nr:polyphosphate kinase 2 family protein [Flavobacteriaceae bacterium]